MRIATGIRLSTTVTAILACLTLGYAEQAFIPGICGAVVFTTLLVNANTMAMPPAPRCWDCS